MKLQDALADYLLQLDADGRSPHTRDQYERHVRLFADWATTAGHDGEIETVDEKLIARFFVADVTKARADGGPRKASSANALRSSIRVFFGFAHGAGWIARNPARLLRRALAGTPRPRAIPADESERLLAAMAKGTDPESRRDHVLFGTLAATGIRIGSALALDAADIDLDRAEILLRKMKGGHAATVYIPAVWIGPLRAHLATVAPDPVFRARSGTRLSQRQAQRRLEIWCVRSGLPRSYSPHAFRHAFAIRAYEKTRDIGLVQAALAHRSIASTVIYARPTAGQVRAAVGAQVSTSADSQRNMWQ